MKALWSVAIGRWGLLGLTTLALCTTPVRAARVVMDGWGYHPEAAKQLVVEDVPMASLDDTELPEMLLENPVRLTWWSKPLHVKTMTPQRVFRQPLAQGPPKASLVYDFSDLTEPGIYQAVWRMAPHGVAPAKRLPPLASAPIVVSPFIFWDAMAPVARSLYFHRCGQALEDPRTHFDRPEAAMPPATWPPNTEASRRENSDEADTLLLPGGAVQGGWCDATGRPGASYAARQTVHETAWALSRLLPAVEANPEAMAHLQLAYPSRDPNPSGLPDFYYELQQGLNWLMRLQHTQVDDPYVGMFRSGIQRQDSQAEDALAPSAGGPAQLGPPQSQATAEAATVLAMAARVYRKPALSYAIACLRAAEQAWTSGHRTGLLETSPGSPTRQAWLALTAELALTTGKPLYRQALLKHVRPADASAWLSPASLAFPSLVNLYTLAGPRRIALPATLAPIPDKLAAMAQQTLDAMARSPYPLALVDFNKPLSNWQQLDQIGLLLAMDKLAPSDKRYRVAAAKALHWLFGLNPLQQVFLTPLLPPESSIEVPKSGATTPPPTLLPNNKPPPTFKRDMRWVQQPASPFMAWVQPQPFKNSIRPVAPPLPGLLVSGIYFRANDGATPAQAGMESYLDDPSAWASNGAGLRGQASLLAVLAGLNTAYNKLQTNTHPRQ